MTIRLLPQNLINQIAAGEVVERPASALKELIENAIDAGSTRIEITVNNGGKSYFSVKDNGKGMTKDELSLAIERHATSKLPTDDLFQINFLGFRGEALPSIASVAKLSITSRPKSSDEAWQITIEGGQNKTLAPAPQGFGTTVEVRELFFATPARLKFLKSDQTEQSYIKDVINRLAMAYPQIHFIFSDERRIVLNYPAVDSLFLRVSQVIGKSFDSNAIMIQTEYDSVKLSGFVGLPTYTRSTSSDQYLYVNGRFIKDKVVIGAVRGAYQGLISHEHHPVLALFLSVPPEDVDVNVHPAKTEVRFKDATHIRSLLVSSIRTALAEHGAKTSSTIGVGALAKSTPSILPHTAYKPHPTFSQEEARLSGVSYRERQHFNPNQQTIPFQQNAFSLKTQNASLLDSLKDQSALNFKEVTDLSEINTPLTSFNESEAYFSDCYPQESQSSLNNSSNQPIGETFPPLGFAKAQLHKTYIISQTPDSIIITDQHASHERLTYEKLMQSSQTKIETQLLLIPEIVDLNQESASLLLERSEELKAFGFVLDSFGGDSIAVREIPALLTKTNISQLLIDLADTLKEFDDTILLKDKIKDICARIACHGSVRAGRELTIDEMNALLRQMENCGTSGQCIHGRPTYIELKTVDIEKLFGRSK